MPGGRDQFAPMERLVRILAVLSTAGDDGAGLDKLFEAGDYGSASHDNKRKQLTREIGRLNKAGWDIENLGGEGLDSRWVLHTRDNRLRVELSPAQRAELARAAALGGVSGFREYVGLPTEPPDQATVEPPAEPPDAYLRLCLSATSQRCIVQFMYKGRPRTVHPRVVQPGPSGWYLVGREEASGIEKRYVIARMSNLYYDRPGTAEPAAEATNASFDPATWDVDPPTDVRVETSPDFAEQVTLAIRPVVEREDDDERTVLTIRVTNRAAFRDRLYTLRGRARVLGPDDVRTEIIEELTANAGHVAGDAGEA